ncbi:MAG: hypothetical protein AB4050_09890 [Synechococcus sp.]
MDLTRKQNKPLKTIRIIATYFFHGSFLYLASACTALQVSETKFLDSDIILTRTAIQTPKSNKVNDRGISIELDVIRREADSARAEYPLTRQMQNAEFIQERYQKELRRFGWDIYDRQISDAINHFQKTIAVVLVIVITAAGLVFSYWEFKRGDTQKINNKKPDPSSEAEGEISEEMIEEEKSTIVFKFHPKSGLEINSSFLGLVILIISLTFFYLYLSIILKSSDPQIAIPVPYLDDIDGLRQSRTAELSEEEMLSDINE